MARFFDLDRTLGPGSLNALLIFSLVIGMSGSIISLLMSKTLAKRSVGARVIETPTSAMEMWLVQTVQRQAADAGIEPPEVAIFDSPVVNAFATGARRNAALVAVSTGLLRSMNRAEAEAVLGHEVSHVANGDMVTLALVQGVVNTFVVFLARVVGMVVDSMLHRGSDRGGYGGGMGYFLTSMVAQIVLGFLASMIVAWFSRYREFRADAGGAALAGRGNMIAALERLKQGAEARELPESLQAFGIRGSAWRQGLAHLFATHPPLERRIEALRAAPPVAR